MAATVKCFLALFPNRWLQRSLNWLELIFFPSNKQDSLVIFLMKTSIILLG